MSSNSEFSFVYVPADSSQPVELIRCSKAGGLENDALRKRAELFFGSKAIDKSSQRYEVVKQLKQNGMDDSSITDAMSKFGDKLAGHVEIITLSLPQARNGFQSVSVYCDGNSRFRSGKEADQPNYRVTLLAQACGHKDLAIMGACFIGRAHDDERVPWERLDFLESDLLPTSTWAVQAAAMNAGKNMSSWSTSGVALNMHEQQQKASSAALTSKPNNPTSSENKDDSDSLPAEGFWWSQDLDEVEVRMPLPADLASKQLLCEIKSGSITLGNKRIDSSQGSPIDGVNPKFTAAMGASTCGDINTADSSWSIQSEKGLKEGQRMLTITIAKKSRKHWKHFFA